MTATEYPKRNSHFAHKFCRLMGKVCIGAEIGADACWLLALIAHTEDAAGYRRPVTFFNDDLASRTGMSVSAMIRARTRAVKAGWLNHTKGVKGRAAFYFVMVPEWARNITDSAGDESPEEWGEILCQIDAQNGGQTAAKRSQSGGQTVTERPQSDKHSSQENQDNQINQNTQEGDGGGGEVISIAPFSEFLAAWNATELPGAGVLRRDSTRVGFWQLRLADEFWREHWREAIIRAGKSDRCRGLTKGWPGLMADTFLKDPSMLTRILEGQFDNPGANRPPPPPTVYTDPDNLPTNRIAPPMPRKECAA